MTGLFGKGGNRASPPTDTEPASLDMTGDKSEIINKIQNPTPGKQIGPSSNDLEEQINKQLDEANKKPKKIMPNATPYQSGGPFSKPKVDSVSDYADMQATDGLKDSDLASLRKDGYKLSNLEKEFQIKHANDFNNIIKKIIIGFALIVGIAFAVIIGVIAWTSYKTNTMTETGIINSFLQFVVDIIKIGLS